MRYRYCMYTADKHGVKEHPQLAIRKLAPDAHDFEPVTIADCWLFTANEIKNAPPFLIPISDK